MELFPIARTYATNRSGHLDSKLYSTHYISMISYAFIFVQSGRDSLWYYVCIQVFVSWNLGLRKSPYLSAKESVTD